MWETEGRGGWSGVRKEESGKAVKSRGYAGPGSLGLCGRCGGESGLYSAWDGKPG